MASVVSRGYKIHYESSGDGPPLMLVPGFTQWAEQWDSAQYVAALNDRFRVVRIDPLGHGLSDKPHEPQAYRWSSVIDDLVAVADAEGLERPMWWRFSRGAELVQDLAHLHPTRAAAVVVGSATNSFGTDVEFDWATITDQLRAGDCLPRLWATLGFIDPAGVEFGTTMNDCDALACVIEGQYLDDFLVYERLDVPALAYKGSLEGYGPLMTGLLATPGFEAHEVSGANHSDAFERSADVLPIVLPFLIRNSTLSGQ